MSNWIKEINDSGKTITLDDHSKWTVSTYGSLDTRFWMKLDNVTFANGKMINHSQREKSVEVKKAN